MTSCDANGQVILVIECIANLEMTFPVNSVAALLERVCV